MCIVNTILNLIDRDYYNKNNALYAKLLLELSSICYDRVDTPYIINKALSIYDDPHLYYSPINNTNKFLPLQFFQKKCYFEDEDYIKEVILINEKSVDIILKEQKCSNNNHSYRLLNDYFIYSHAQNIKLTFANNTFKNVVLAAHNQYSQSVTSSILANNFRTVDNIAIIRLLSFKDYFVKIFLKHLMAASNCEYLIIDLRQNPGGEVQSAKTAASYFLKDGTMLYYKQSRTEVTEEFISPDKKNHFEFNEIFILQDEGTASSSEFIFIRALQKSSIVLNIVGTQSAGLFSQANNYLLPDKSRLVLTTHRLLDTNMELIPWEGIKPSTFLDFNPTKRLSYNDIIRCLNISRSN